MFLVKTFIQRKVRKNFSEQYQSLPKRRYQYKLKYLFSIRNLNDLTVYGEHTKDIETISSYSNIGIKDVLLSLINISTI